MHGEDYSYGRWQKVFVFTIHSRKNRGRSRVFKEQSSVFAIKNSIEVPLGNRFFVACCFYRSLREVRSLKAVNDTSERTMNRIKNFHGLIAAEKE